MNGDDTARLSASERKRTASYSEIDAYARRAGVRGQYRPLYDSYLRWCECGNHDDLSNSTECLQRAFPEWFDRYTRRK
jgi:hypothetical protein